MVVKKKHNDDIAKLEIFGDIDDCQVINQIGNCLIELIPEANFCEENNSPDWFGYLRIDKRWKSKIMQMRIYEILNTIFDYSNWN